ncbi:MAG: OmpA family protein [Pirellulales bacterium]|nr:OmpA family protein [Pirellulales bacterium]
MSKGKLLAVCIVWLVVLGIGAAIWKLVIRPAVTPELEQSSRYDYRVPLALDSFSGYAVLRGEAFREELAKRRIKLDLVDDGADYAQRAKALADGDTPMAVFTIDALVKTAADLGRLPGVIVAVIDETRGADAMVAYKNAIPNVDALNDPRTKFVLTPNSPSETLARVVMAHFDLGALGENPIVEAADAEDVYRRYRTAKPDTHQVFVLWEPYVSKILENPNTHVVVDSGRFPGYIVDVLVANEDYLLKNEDVVASIVEAYFRALFAHREAMVDLVLSDAKALGAPLTPKQAENLARGVRWKNTQENYAHMGLENAASLQHVEDMIANITEVLLRTRAMRRDPTDDQPNRLYYAKVLARLRDGNFHPGEKAETVRGDQDLGPLTDAEWERLVPVGTIKIPPLVFARGTAALTSQSQSELDRLIERLGTIRYYVLIRGNASRQGDLEANKVLAQRRAQAAEEYLIQHGVSRDRVRAVGGEPSGSTSVSFVLGRPAY